MENNAEFIFTIGEYLFKKEILEDSLEWVYALYMSCKNDQFFL